MPKTGTPVPYTDGSMVGAPSTWTDFGPPLRMIPLGLRASISDTGMVCGTISEYTCASRTRRAISCAYCAPKSTTRTVSNDSVMTSYPVVGRFLGDHHVVGMALAQARRRDADEAPVLLQLGDAARPAVAHRLTQATDELMQHVGERALVRHASLDALGHDLAALDRALEVAV